MAKAKKTTTDAPAGEAKKPKGKSKPAAKPVAATPPMVDTTLAAAAVAKGLVAGLSAAPTAAAGKSSASFEKMKESLGKSAGGLGAALDKSAPSGLKKPPRGFGTNSPTIGGGRNQTFGADVSRASVPRRTGGG